jgi:hypothetical protein
LIYAALIVCSIAYNVVLRADLARIAQGSHGGKR